MDGEAFSRLIVYFSALPFPVCPLYYGPPPSTCVRPGVTPAPSNCIYRPFSLLHSHMYLYLFLDNLSLCPAASHSHTIIAHHPLHVLHPIPHRLAHPSSLIIPVEQCCFNRCCNCRCEKKYTLSKCLPAAPIKRKNTRVAGFRALFLL